MADMGSECESYFQGKINSMLVTTSWVDDLKEILGMEAVSQIWGEIPAWYLWLSDASGVYRLQLADTMIDENISAGKQAYFSLKCYPFCDSNVFDTFSYEEQVLSRSRFFDDTHTPRFEEIDRIPDTLFNVAAMEYRVNQDETMACFTLDSLDILRCIYPEETTQNFGLIEESRRFRKGEIGRAVPGWQLGYPVFDRLLCMYAFYSKTAPIRIRITRSPGFHFRHSRNHIFECLKAPDISQLTASVVFAAPNCPEMGTRLNEPDIMALEEEPGPLEILWDHSFACGHLHLSEKTASLQAVEGAPINPLWWSLAETAYKSNLASTCGCH